MHRYCRLFLPFFRSFSGPLERLRHSKNGRLHELRQDRTRRTDGRFLPIYCGFWLVSRCFAGMVRRGSKRSPRRNETARKNFSESARVLGSQAPQAPERRHSTFRGLARFPRWPSRGSFSFLSRFSRRFCLVGLLLLWFTFVCFARSLCASLLEALSFGLAYFMAC